MALQKFAKKKMNPSEDKTRKPKNPFKKGKKGQMPMKGGC